MPAIHWNTYHSSGRVSFCAGDGGQTVRDVLVHGAAVAPFCLSAFTLNRFEQEARRLRFAPAAAETETGVTQDFDVCASFAPGSLYRELALATEGALERFLGERVDFDDWALQRYRVSAPGQRYAISPHRDYARCRGVVAVWLIYGESQFHLCEGRDGSGARLVGARPGQLVLMRAGGLGGGDAPGPLHFVGPLAEERMSFALRQMAPAAPRP